MQLLKRFLAKQAQQPAGLFGNLIAGRAFNKTNKKLEEMILRLMKVQENSNVLEIGFGNGRLAGMIADDLKTGLYCGIEISDVMLHQALKRNKVHVDLGRIELKKGSVDQIPHEDEQFDNIITANTVYFWPDPKNDIREVLRVLKADGTFYCGFRTREQMEAVGVMKDNPDIFRNLYTEGEMKAFLLDAGFSDVSVEYQQDKPLDSYVAIARK